MQTVRRIYLYLVSAISLVAVTWALIGLARLIIAEGLGQDQILWLATLLATIIVGLPIFLFHWLSAQRLAVEQAEERQSSIRQLYFYLIMAVGAVPILANVYYLLDNLLVALVGGSQPDYYPYDLTTGERLAAILIWGVVWLYIWRYARQQTDPQVMEVQPLNLSIRRLYLLLFSLAGLVMLSWGLTGLLQLLLQAQFQLVWDTPIAHHLTQILLGLGAWLAHWVILQRDFASGHPAEERSVLRKAYLYLTVFVFSVMALASGTAILQRLLELALGGEPSGEPLLSQLSGPLPFFVVGGLFWAYHWRVVRYDASQAPEGARQASVRRIYAYLVAAVGLATLLTGLVGLLTVLIDLLTTPDSAGFGFYRAEVALFVAMTLVGTPVWWLPWRAMQTLAVRPAEAEEADRAASEERRSTVRKIYLYFFVFIASLAIFSSVGWFVYHILTALLGADLPDDFLTLVLDALVIALLAAGVWWYHWWAIRRDGQLAETETAERYAETLILVLDADQGQLGQAVLAQLREELPGVQLKSLGLTPRAQEVMDGLSEEEAPQILRTAHYLIGSWQALSASSVKAEANPEAVKVAIPVRERNWVWAGIEGHSPDYYARQAVEGVKQALAGEEIRFDQGLDTGTVVAIGIGVLIFLCLGSSLLGVAANFF